MEPPACSSLPPAFWQGVAQFNAQEFYACHDTLEDLWMEALDPDRTFYQGVLQIAVALYHRSHGNVKGAMTLLGEGIGRLGSYQPAYGGLEVTQLLTEGRLLLGELQTQGQSDRTLTLQITQPTTE